MNAAIWITTAWGAGACVADRDRPPGDPTGPLADSVPSVLPPGASLVRIVQPAAGVPIQKVAFLEEPGVEVVYVGPVPPSHTIVIEAYQNNHLLPFSGHWISVTEGSDPPRSVFLRGTPQHLETAERVTIHLRMLDSRSRALARDSVVVPVG